MSWTNPRPNTFTPPALSAVVAPDIQAELTKAGIDAVTGIRVLADQTIQVSVPGQNERIYIKDGQIIKNADQERAVMLARHYTKVTEPITELMLVDKFGNRYPEINRFLPAWKISFDRPDGLIVYVETDTDRLGTIVNTRKAVLQSIFQTLHTWNFLDGVEGIRLAILTCLLMTIMGMMGLGIAMFFVLKRPNGTKGMRKVHRVMTAIFWLPFIAFSLTGLFHLVMNSPALSEQGAPPRPAIQVSELPPVPELPQMNLRLVILKDKHALWYKDSQDDRNTAILLANSFSGRNNPVSFDEVKTFSNEYSFAYKRLPIWRVAYPDGEVLFVEPRTGTLAARANSIRKSENWTFSTFHKWEFLDPFVSKKTRDMIRMNVVVFSILMVISGLVLLNMRRP